MTSLPQRILIIGSVWPEPNSSAAGARMMQLINVFLVLGYRITFASTAAESPFAANLDELGITPQTIQLNDSRFDDFVKQLQPTIVLFDRFMTEEQFGWRVAATCPDALRILDTEDLHCLRYARQQALKQNRNLSHEDLVNDIAKREIASILRCDSTLIISEYEMNLLKKFYKVDSRLLYYLPYLLNEVTKQQSKQWPAFEERIGFVFIGNFLHEPNWDALNYLKKEIWPLIKQQMPDAVIHVYGAYVSQKVTALNNPKEGFLIKGRADDAHVVVSKARACLAPLRFGAGLKGKLVEAMQCGTPSVSTTIGAEGIAGAMLWNGVIADSAVDIANAAVHLYSDKKLWTKAQQNGVKIINKRFLRNLFETAFIKHIQEVQLNLKKQRTANFTGAMLMHHTTYSSMYMSKWIEEKNKV